MLMKKLLQNLLRRSDNDVKMFLTNFIYLTSLSAPSIRNCLYVLVCVLHFKIMEL